MGKTHVDSLVRFKLFKDYVGEFDPGSGRTLAACLIHASRTLKEELASPDELRTGE